MIGNICRVSALLLTVSAVLVASGCGETPEKRMRAAQPMAERYFEYLKLGDYTGAYRNTFSKTYQSQLDAETYAKYRAGMANRIGQIKSARLVDTKDNPANGRVRLIYSLEVTNGHVEPQEVLDLAREDGEWRIAAVDMKMPPTQQQQPQQTAPTTAPFPLGGSKAPAGR